MLNKEKLMEMKPGEIFATGAGTYPEVVGYEIRWAACRGEGFHDWCIYAGDENMPYSEIKRIGDKIFTESVIKRWVPCDDAAWSLYRF